MTYTTLNDAVTTSATLAPAPEAGIKVWYQKREPADWPSDKHPPGTDLRMGMDFLREHKPEMIPTTETLSTNHVLLGTVEGSKEFSNDSSEDYRNMVFETIYTALQGHNWSPVGEARELVLAVNASHTSMSVGDVLQVGDDLYMADSVGFTKL